MFAEQVEIQGSTLYSQLFQDIYFHRERGLEESTHVFLKGVELQESVVALPKATLVELGFGAGLNFLLTAQLLQTLPYSGNFSYFSVESRPLGRDILSKLYAQKTFAPLSGYYQRLLDVYPSSIQAGQSLQLDCFPNVQLILLLYPVEEALCYTPSQVDYWYLDGFNPKTNPQMWGEAVSRALREKSCKGARLATFSACRLVKNSLDSANFHWERVKGFNQKKHSLKAYKL